MSRHYRMEISIHGLKDEEVVKINQALLDIWDWDYQEEETEKTKEQYSILSFAGEGNLTAGRSEESFADEVIEKVWAITKRFVLIEVVATYLEQAPYESYVGDEQRFEYWSKKCQSSNNSEK